MVNQNMGTIVIEKSADHTDINLPTKQNLWKIPVHQQLKDIENINLTTQVHHSMQTLFLNPFKYG